MRLIPFHSRRSFLTASLSTCLLFLTIATAGTFLAVSPVDARGESQAIHKVKAAFIYQFTRFIEWPEATFAEKTSPIIICVSGDQALLDTLQELVAKKEVGGHPFEIRAPSVMMDPEECHILYIASDQSLDKYEAVLSGSSTMPVLTVGDAKNFTAEGGVVRLYERKSKLGIEINIDAATRRNLKISSKLLGLADVVHDDPPLGD